MIAFLTTADTDILTLLHVVPGLPAGFPDVRAANPSSAPTAVELAHQAETAVLMRLLGGRRPFEPAFSEVRSACLARGVPFVACAGDSIFDPELASLSTLPPETVREVFAYLCHGGSLNLRNLLLRLAHLPADPPAELPWFGLCERDPLPCPLPLGEGASVAVLFYRAHWMSGNTDFVDALCDRLEHHGCRAVPIFVYSLKPENAAQIEPLLREARVDAIVNTLSFATGSVDWLSAPGGLDVPVLQAIVSTSPRADWRRSQAGLSPLDTAMNVALPEFDGSIITVPVSFKEELPAANGLGSPVMRYVPDPERVDAFARLARNWAQLRRKPNAAKRIAFVLANYPTKNARLGNAVGLDTPASLLNVLRAMREAGYTVGDLPQTGDELIFRLIDRCSNDRELLTVEQLRNAVGHVPAATYGAWYEQWPERVRARLRGAWGEPPGEVFVLDGGDSRLTTRDSRLVIPGIVLGNIFVGVQPPRGFGENPIAIYHSPDLPPTHHYLAYYRWIRDVFKADAVVHVGKHGTLEWLPGKALGLSDGCYPDLAITDLPHFYPFIINNPGEGAQAKRRSHAAIVDHLIPAMTTADAYNEIVRIEQLMDEYYQVQTLDPKKGPIIRDQIWETVVSAQLHRDLGEADLPEDFDAFLLHVDGYLCELKDSQIRDGLHILGQPPRGSQLVDLLLALTRLDNVETPSLRAATARALGIESFEALLADRGAVYAGPPLEGVRSNGDAIEYIEAVNRSLIQIVLDGDDSKTRSVFQPARPLAGFARTRGHAEPAAPEQVGAPSRGQAEAEPIKAANAVQAGGPQGAGGRENATRFSQAPVSQTLGYIQNSLLPALEQTTDEITNLLRGLEGRFIPPGPSGAPTRGMANVLPTGRNFYSVDPKALPSPAAWQIGKQLADALLAKYLQEEGRYPESVGIVVWGTSAMRTQGDDVAEILWLLGVRPVWMKENRRVTGLELIPLEELRRPRIDVTVRISGFFRDAFPNLVHLIDDAVRLAAQAPEDDAQNLVAAHFRRDGHTDEALYRIFGSKPGTYGAGILPLLDARNWTTDQDLAEVYAAWGGYAYTRTDYGRAAKRAFEQRFAEISIATKNQDNREHDIFDSDDYMQYHGGMIATIRALTGKNPRQFFGDSANPSLVRVRDLDDEARRVFRSRVINPKWIESVKRHGYKGAFELAATVDYLFGYDATAHIVEDWMYERVTRSYVQDPAMQDFFAEKNPWALRGIAERLLEAIERGMWKNPSQEQKEALQQAYLTMDTVLEARTEA